MDYHSIHGHDVSSFDLPSTHRMPTVSAAQALEELDDDPSRYVSTSLPDLDKLLGGGTPGLVGDSSEQGGVQKGQVTEIWGPPGVGKTTFGIQLAANALRHSKSVVWVDGFHSVCYERFTNICSTESRGDTGDESSTSCLDRLLHYTCPSLAHFIALTCRPTPLSITPDTALVVIDSLSALINHAFPRLPDPKAGSKGNNKVPSTSARRLQVLQYIIGALQKLAATRSVAVVVLTQCATRMQAERGATLVPAIAANVWEQGIAARVALFRDFEWIDGQTSDTHLAAVQKVNGKVTAEPMDNLCAFGIETKGVSTANYHGGPPTVALHSTPAPKRKLRDTDFEIPDSDDDEDYGWQEEDAMPPMPSQCQGSEDILIQPYESGDDEADEAQDSELDAPESKEDHAGDED